MNVKHGLSQYKLNHAKSYAQEMIDTVCKIELMFQASLEGFIDFHVADSYIERNIEELNNHCEQLKRYAEQREDMR